jgi:hypothetical protein
VGPGRRYGIEAIHLGSSDPVIARAIAALTPADLVLDAAMPGWELDLRFAELRDEPDLPAEVEVLNGYCISPIRVTRPLGNGRHEDLTQHQTNDSRAT